MTWIFKDRKTKTRSGEFQQCVGYERNQFFQIKGHFPRAAGLSLKHNNIDFFFLKKDGRFLVGGLGSLSLLAVGPFDDCLLAKANKTNPYRDCLGSLWKPLDFQSGPPPNFLTMQSRLSRMMRESANKQSAITRVPAISSRDWSFTNRTCPLPKQREPLLPIPSQSIFWIFQQQGSVYKQRDNRYYYDDEKDVEEESLWYLDIGHQKVA